MRRPGKSLRSPTKRRLPRIGKSSQDVYLTRLGGPAGSDQDLASHHRGKIALRNSRRGGLAERAYDHLKQMLVTGAVTDQQWFPIDDIAAQLEIGRAHV